MSDQMTALTIAHMNPGVSAAQAELVIGLLRHNGWLSPADLPAADLREQLRAAIDDAGRHQVTIAADLGVTTKHLCAMLTGRAKLTLEWAERIAAQCGRRVVVLVLPADRPEATRA
jgi:hypothetical protein